MIYYYAGSFIVAFLMVAAIVPITRRWALRIGFLDVPAGFKTHKAPTPLGGGLAVFTGSVFLITGLMGLFGFDIPQGAIGIIAGTTLAALVGIYDDYFHMGPLLKTMGELIAAIIFLTFIDRIPTVISYPAYFLIASVWIIGIQNAINFIDNLDGMCSGISLTIAVGFGILFMLKGMPVYAILSFGLAGGALGFLRYNLPPAKIFLGDGGSLLFGFALACLGIVHLNSSKSMADALAPILIMAFPIFDMTLVTITRLNKGIKVYIASKDHAWDMIRVLGLTREATVNFVLFINLILVASGILIFFLEGSPIQTLIVVAFALLLAFIGTQLYKNFLFLRFNVLAILIDLFAVNLSFVAYYFIKYESGLLSYTSYIPPDMLAVPLAWINMFWIILYSAMGLYDISFERKYLRHFSILVKSIIVAAAIFLMVNFKPGYGFQISLSSTAVFVIILFMVSSGLRAAMYKWISFKLSADNQRLNAVIVSSREPRDDTLKVLNSYNILGYVGQNGKSEITRLGELSELNTILKNTKTARVILALDDSDYIDLRNVFNSSYYMETIFLSSNISADNLVGLKRYPTVNKELDIISIRHRRLFPMIFNRLANAIFSLTLAILFSPYWSIKILSRKIKNEQVFDNITIMTQLEKEIKIKRFKGDDKLSLTNPWIIYAIFRGKFNLYGVTIDSPDEYKASLKSLPGYWRKFLIKPGLFGPGYDGRNDNERFAFDLLYLKKTSFFGDIAMIVRQLSGKKINGSVTSHA